MKVRITSLALLLGAGMAMAQVAPTTPMKVAEQLKPEAPPSQAVAGQPAAPAKPAAQSLAAKPVKGSSAAAAKPAAHSPFGGAAKAKPAKATKAAAESAAAPEMAKAVHSKAGRRDPFVSPIVRAVTGPVQSCTTGKRCLSATEMMLRGVVKSQNGMIAVVENAQHKTYFLRENDAIFNGVVVRITGDGLILRENGYDTLGNPTSHEVVKKVAPTA